ncbi:MAG: Holliday junction branch migration protein RuvA [Lachnospiraceae bacterium]|nr:Holliday junction branch migration protein RuvA [Lachnospiraceae bacterium]
MIAYIDGTVEQITATALILDHEGVGYEIHMPVGDLPGVGKRGDTCRIYTTLSFSENTGVVLYGFLTMEEKEMYLLLTTVSGVGPKAALAILSVLSPQDLKFAIVGEDEKSITVANGVGPKMARRVILELKDKVDLEAAVSSDVSTGSDPMQISSTVREDVLLGLTAMGFSGAEAMSAIAAVEDAAELDSTALLKAALKKLAK